MQHQRVDRQPPLFSPPPPPPPPAPAPPCCKKEKEMKPPADEAPTKEELEAARILCKFPELVLEAESRRLPDFFRWGTRRRRSALDDDDDDDDAFLLAPPPPPPPISPPPDGNDERKDGGRGGGATSSPTTPLSFPASGGEEPDGRPPRPPRSPPAKVFKDTKRHLEWVKEQSQLISSLSDQKAHLQRSIAEFDALYQKLKARNSWLRDLQSKAARETMAEEGQRRRPRQRQDGSSGPAPLGPTALQSPSSRGWETQPPPVGRGTPWPSVAAAGRWPEKVAALDLNASPEEEEEEGEEEEQRVWERSSAYKAAMSAQARKRRLEIQREKNNNHSSSLFSMAHRMPRSG